MLLKIAKSPSEILFLYETRTNPKIDEMMSGNPPKDYSSHIDYISKVQEKERWIFVAYEKGDMVAYSQIYNVDEDSCEVGFAVSPLYQGKGYGKNLVISTISKCKELFPNKKIVLYVLSKNTKAKNIYLKNGFKEKILKNSSSDLIGMVLEND
jgi:RimJ/RimL family protein N-acetyltransferase